ncbi:hypothetical protein LCGC14_1920840, partial [marine sediment metagenome]
ARGNQAPSHNNQYPAHNDTILQKCFLSGTNNQGHLLNQYAEQIH